VVYAVVVVDTDDNDDDGNDNCDDDDDDDDDRRPTETRASTHTNTTQQCASMLALRMSRTNGFLGLARSQAEATRFKEDGKLPKSSRRLSAS